MKTRIMVGLMILMGSQITLAEDRLSQTPEASLGRAETENSGSGVAREPQNRVSENDDSYRDMAQEARPQSQDLVENLPRERDLSWKYRREPGGARAR